MKFVIGDESFYFLQSLDLGGDPIWTLATATIFTIIVSKNLKEINATQRFKQFIFVT